MNSILLPPGCNRRTGLFSVYSWEFSRFWKQRGRYTINYLYGNSIEEAPAPLVDFDRMLQL